MAHIAVERRSVSMDKWSRLVFSQVEEEVITGRFPIDGWEIRNGQYFAAGYQWEDDFHPIQEGDAWGGPDVTCEMRATFTVPKELDGKKVYLYMFTSSEVMVSENGHYIDGLDPNRCWFPYLENARAGETHTLHLEAYTRSKPDDDRGMTRKLKGCIQRFVRPALILIDEEMLALKYDLDMLYQCAYAPHMDDGAKEFYQKKIEEILPLFPLFESGEPGVMKEALPAIRQFMQDKVYGSDKIFGHKGKLACVAHSHLDIAYHWKVEQTIQKNARTALIQLRLMDRWPEFGYAHTQAWTYEQLEKHYPEIFEQVRQRIQEGRWEVVGGMYVEPDCNVISAESMIRQILYGKGYFKEKFGVDADNAWLPDVFGNSAIMPQILKKCGIPYFVSNKMSTWNDTNTFPHNHFIWRGLDGSEVYACVPPVHFITWMDPAQAIDHWEMFQDKDISPESLQMFGYGDGGSGATDEMMEYYYRQQKLGGIPAMRLTTGKEFLHSAFENAEDFPRWDGDLYLEMHRGTFTTKGALKRENRRGEFQAQRTETMAAVAALSGKEAPTPADLRTPWKKLLLNQFHDILPGSHTAPVAVDALETYRQMREEFTALESSARNVLATSAADRYFTANLMIDSRRLAYAPAESGFRALRDENGGLHPVQKILHADGTEELCADLGCVPGMTFQNYTAADSAEQSEGMMTASTSCLENDFFRVEIAEDGEIRTIFDKKRGLPVNAEGKTFNEWQLFEDCPGVYNAWDIVRTFENKRIELPGWENLMVCENGPISAAVRMERRFGSSIAVQIVRIWRNIPRVDFDTWVDWHEDQKLLKAAFPVNVHARTYSADTSAGIIERMNNRNTTWEQARFEVPCHKWVDLSEGMFGVSILNDCKYGCDVKDDTVRLSLLRATIRPDRESDRGQHRFTYSVCPHGASWQQDGVAELAYDLNAPLALCAGEAESAGKCWMEVSAPALKMQAMKQAEDNSGDIVVRLTEVYSSRGTAALRPGFAFRKAYLCNMLEEKETELSVKDGIVSLPYASHEILTVRFER
ncbi:MAG: alpha-mannosidase [Candidatus Merdivicinus sp.]|jgi:alpha-mannosidase